MFFGSRAVVGVLAAAGIFSLGPVRAQSLPSGLTVQWVQTLTASSYSFEAGASVTYSYGYEVIISDPASWFFASNTIDTSMPGVLSARIHFADGTSEERLNLSGPEGLESFEHIYTAPGTYWAYVEASLTGYVVSRFYLEDRQAFPVSFPLQLWGAQAPVQVAAPIPEPETYAMLLAGLAVLGIARRRQRMRAAA